jgi:hypothetical protein
MAGGVTGSIDHSANNELLRMYGDISFEYAANGNMKAKTSASENRDCSCNADNRLISLSFLLTHFARCG